MYSIGKEWTGRGEESRREQRGIFTYFHGLRYANYGWI